MDAAVARLFVDAPTGIICRDRVVLLPKPVTATYRSHQGDDMGQTLNGNELLLLTSVYVGVKVPHDHGMSVAFTSLVTHKGLLDVTDGAEMVLTEKGRVFVEHLLNQPMPVQSWAMPT